MSLMMEAIQECLNLNKLLNSKTEAISYNLNN